MVRNVHRLTALAVKRAKRPGFYSDGGGLYLLVSKTGARSWVFRFSLNGKAYMQGIGSAAANGVTLAQARDMAAAKQGELAAGRVPMGKREARRIERAKAAPKTFRQCAADYIKAHSGSWKNAKHRAQWEATLEQYAYPVFGDLPVGKVDLAQMLRMLEPIWRVKPETASRLRGRVEAILDSALVSGDRQGENPARWKGWLQTKLPPRSKVRRVRHHPAMAYKDVGAFMARLRKEDGIAARALEFVILTVPRTSETIGAMWSEIDLANALWIIPPERIKAEREHRVPLSPAAVALLEDLQRLQLGSKFVFPGRRAGKPLSNMAMLALLGRMGHDDCTVHGFRSTFRDWVGERTAYPREIAEVALSHALKDKTEAAYQRGDYLEKRRRLMDEWATFCGTVAKGGKVVPINRAAQQ
jgi:integrase